MIRVSAMTRRWAAVAVVWTFGFGFGLLGQTWGAFSDTTDNAGNTFQAAATWCTAPGPQTVITTADAWIEQANPTANYGAGAALRVRSQTGSSNRRTVVYFPLPAIPAGCTLTSATLRLFATSAAGGRTIDAYRASAAWAEGTVTWNTQPGVTGAAVGSASASGWVQWDVTAHVVAMYAGSNYGWKLRDRVENAGSAQQQVYRSSEAGLTPPELVLTFG